MILVNGLQSNQISVLDRGLHYGDGLFETIALRNNKLQHWELHWQRLVMGCERLNLPVPDDTQLLEEIHQVMGEQAKAVIKVIYTRGAGGRGYRYGPMQATRIVMSSPWPDYPLENSRGINLFLCDTRLAIQPKLAGIKHLNRLENVLARSEWQDEHYSEGLLLSTVGNVIEGCMSNIFVAKNSVLFTPDVSQCGVDGVMRRYLITLAEQHAMTCRIASLSLDEIYQADEMFVCNSLIGIWPVASLGQTRFNVETTGNPITRKLQLQMSRE